VISNPDPVYPPEAAELGYGGTVKMDVRVDKVGKLRVLRAWGPIAPCSNLKDGRVKKIREAVIETASKVLFEPPLKNGKPTEIDLRISYSFDIDGKPVSTNDVSGSTRRIVDAGILQGRFRHLARPDYPAGARSNRVTGAVPVSVLTDVNGKIIAAGAIGGHSLLQEPAVEAACSSSIEPVQLSGVPVQVSGIIIFNFTI